MKRIFYFIILLTNISFVYSQSIEDAFSQEKMRKDLQVFRNIRTEVNSGLYKYRSKSEIDSIYNWASEQISQAKTYREFYNIIIKITDFEGSLHNSTSLPKKMNKSLKNEKNGYFPYPIKSVNGKWIFNFDKGKVPLGAEIISINNEEIEKIIENLYKYCTTDGINITGKRIDLIDRFSKYYRLHYGLNDTFILKYRPNNSTQTKSITLESIGNKSSYSIQEKRHSKPFDKVYYQDWKDNEMYSYKPIDQFTGILTINNFGMGNENDDRHLKFVSFLDSTFINIKNNGVKNLIVDVRYNGGGTDPNDLVTYSYLTDRNFSENIQAWITFQKIPYLKYIESKIPPFLRPLGVGKYNKWFKEEFYIEKNGAFYQGPLSEDHKIRKPNKNAFDGQVYLLISPRVASAGSLFASMVAGNQNTIVIGEETMGGYYGHNGHTPMTYILPKSKIATTFSIVNLEQDVPKKVNQIYNRGIIPDIEVSQNFEDYLENKDVQMEYVLKLIKKSSTE